LPSTFSNRQTSHDGGSKVAFPEMFVILARGTAHDGSAWFLQFQNLPLDVVSGSDSPQIGALLHAGEGWKE